MSATVSHTLTPDAPIHCTSPISIPAPFIISPPIKHTHEHAHAVKHTQHALVSHLSPPSLPRIPGPFITRRPLTVTDGPARHWHSPSLRLIRPQQQTDSWSNMSSGGETAAINNLRHMITSAWRSCVVVETKSGVGGGGQWWSSMSCVQAGLGDVTVRARETVMVA